MMTLSLEQVKANLAPEWPPAQNTFFRRSPFRSSLDEHQEIMLNMPDKKV
jgi:hypothetical protein